MRKNYYEKRRAGRAPRRALTSGVAGALVLSRRSPDVDDSEFAYDRAA